MALAATAGTGRYPAGSGFASAAGSANPCLTALLLRSKIVPVSTAHRGDGGVARTLHQLNRLALWAIMVLYVPLILGVAGGLCTLGYLVTRYALQHSGDPRFLLKGGLILLLDLGILGTCLLLLLGLLPLLFREGPDLPLSRRISRQEHPTLFQLVEGFARRLDTSPPDEIRVSPVDNACIADVVAPGPNGRGKQRRRVLIVGAGLVVHLSITELGTVLCHELAHGAGGDTRLSRTAGRCFNSMTESITMHAREPDGESRDPVSFLLYYALYVYYVVFTLIYARDRRARELRADRRSAEVCGPQNVRNALMKSHLAGYLPEVSLRRLYVEYFENERDIDNIYQEYRSRWRSLRPERVQKAENEMFLERHSMLDMHPRLADRMSHLKNVKAKEWAVNKPATKLFTKWPDLEREMTRVLVTIGREIFAAHLENLDRELRRPVY